MKAWPAHGYQPSILDLIRTDEMDKADKLEMERYGAPPFQAHSATSKEAADSIREQTANLRERIYDFIKAVGHGVSDERISAVTGIQQNTVRPRRIELVKAGRVMAAPYPTKTVSGRKATAWIATPVEPT